MKAGKGRLVQKKGRRTGNWESPMRHREFSGKWKQNGRTVRSAGSQIVIWMRHDHKQSAQKTDTWLEGNKDRRDFVGLGGYRVAREQRSSAKTAAALSAFGGCLGAIVLRGSAVIADVCEESLGGACRIGDSLVRLRGWNVAIEGIGLMEAER
ncbi:hypothetical protein VUR80DRAFT_4099 [Thermomyces stellatus]